MEVYLYRGSPQNWDENLRRAYFLMRVLVLPLFGCARNTVRMSILIAFVTYKSRPGWNLKV